MKTIIAGSRQLNSENLVRKAIELSGFKITEVISGMARGPDIIGYNLAKEYNIPVQEFKPDWNIGKRAGYIRNSQMANVADALIAVYDGVSKGTNHMINIAMQKEIPVFVFKTKFRYFEETKVGIQALDTNQIFVFGSNEGGRHGSGAAKTAIDKFGAIYGKGIGMTGDKCYGIPTKNQFIRPLTIDKIRLYVYDFIDFANKNPDKDFVVTKVGCGLAGFKDSDIAPMFKNAPSNCIFSNDWIDYLEEV